jgi:hypothetical protein
MRKCLTNKVFSTKGVLACQVFFMRENLILEAKDKYKHRASLQKVKAYVGVYSIAFSNWVLFHHLKYLSFLNPTRSKILLMKLYILTTRNQVVE